MVFQVGEGDGFAPRGDVAFDAAKGFLVELLRAVPGSGLVFVAASVGSTRHSDFDLSFPRLAFRIAVPVLVV